MTEHEALLRQARSDFFVFEYLLAQKRSTFPECHPLHYLQMATEKLAKAIFLRLGIPIDRFSHVAFSHIPRQLVRMDLARTLGFKSFPAYRNFLARTAPFFRAIDELNPAVGPQLSRGGAKEGPNVEYPWPGRDPSGNPTWTVPCEHRFALLAQLRRPGDAARVHQFVSFLLDNLGSLF